MRVGCVTVIDMTFGVKDHRFFPDSGISADQSSSSCPGRVCNIVTEVVYVDPVQQKGLSNGESLHQVVPVSSERHNCEVAPNLYHLPHSWPALSTRAWNAVLEGRYPRWRQTLLPPPLKVPAAPAHVLIIP